MNYISIPDIIGFIWFITAWVGYSNYADGGLGIGKSRTNNLLGATNLYRLRWMQEMLKRENRTMDAIMVGNLLRSITFFANTTIFILLGLMTMMGYHDKLNNIMNDIPFATPTQGFMWEVKIMLLIIIFIFAFFKYTWSLRQYNYAGIVIASAPSCRDRVDEHPDFAQKGAKLVGNAARHFNEGLRAYYFGLAVLAWFVDAYFFMLATAWVVYVTHRREYRSMVLQTLTHKKADEI